MFQYPAKIRLHHTDAAGVLYFARQFELMHEAYEAFLEMKGMPLENIGPLSKVFLPIVHAEADFSAPLSAGKSLLVSVEIERVGTTSFTIGYRLADNENTALGSGKTVHACIDQSSRQKRELPVALRTMLEFSMKHDREDG